VHDDLTTRRILAMDYMDGEALDSLGRPGVPQKERDRCGSLLQRLLFRELYEFRTMQTDPNFANYLYRPMKQAGSRSGEGRIVLLDFGSTTHFSKEFTERFAKISRALIAATTAPRAATPRRSVTCGQRQPLHAERLLAVIRLGLRAHLPPRRL
jgi:predicted unusual protein kinase regulating ubiquinone biosynthesis (AarF/ABC1/UbiB family)